MQTYLHCVPFGSTMDRFGMTAATDGTSVRCPPDFLMRNDRKSSSCAAISRLRIVALQYMRVGEVVCDLHDTHVRIICPVCDVTHMRKYTRPSPA